MRDPIILLVHLIATLARLMGPGGLRSVVAESVLVKQQLPHSESLAARASDRILTGVCALFMRPARVIRSAIMLRPSTILEFHRALRTASTAGCFHPKRRRTGPQGLQGGGLLLVLRREAYHQLREIVDQCGGSHRGRRRPVW